MIVSREPEDEKAIVKKEEVPNLFPVARALFKSGIFPNVRNEYGAFSIVQYGHELGIGPMTALQSMSIVQGKICMAGQMMLSIALRNGVTYEIKIHNSDKCEILFVNGKIQFLSSFTIAEAKQAGIWKAQGGWEKYPQDMLFWRTVTRGLRRVCPDAILGLYAKEELEDAPALNNITQEIQEEKEPLQQAIELIHGDEDDRLSAIHAESQKKMEEIKERLLACKNKFELKGAWQKRYNEMQNSLLPEHLAELTSLKDTLKEKLNGNK